MVSRMISSPINSMSGYWTSLVDKEGYDSQAAAPGLPTGPCFCSLWPIIQDFRQAVKDFQDKRIKVYFAHVCKHSVYTLLGLSVRGFCCHCPVITSCIILHVNLF